MARFVADHAGEFVVGLREVEQPDIDVDEAAERRERVDVGHVENLDRVRHVLARRAREERLADAVDPGVEQRIGDDVGLRENRFVGFFAHFDFGRG